MKRTRVYRGGNLDAEGFPVEDISDHLQDEGAVVWLDLCEPTADELRQMADELGLHALAVEDATTPHERPKLDHYSTHLYLDAYSVAFNPETGIVEKHEIGAFITPHALITVRKDEGFDIDEVVKRWDETPELTKEGVSFLLYGLLDAIVDSHFDAVQSLDGAMEELEELLFSESRDSITRTQRRSFELRKSLVELRRAVLPMREVVNALMRPAAKVVDDDIMPYFQDVYDHVLRAGEWTESLRDFVTTILETNLTIQGNRQNTVMKKVTSWAAIIAVPTAVTGYYGQNVPYPGFGHASGFIVSSAIIVLLSVGLYVIFKRQDWL
jgi:magnesium transporter